MRRTSLLLIALTSACSDSVSGASFPDALAVAPLDDAQGAVDTGPDSASFPDLGMSDATPGPGVTPSYCNENADCPSGYCVEHLCASTCVDTCPGGAVCKAIAQAGADVAFVCVPQFPKLCRPCLSDSDCVGMVAVGDDRCIEFGPEGSFCGGDCTTAACPDGYACEDAPGGRRQCVPQDGQCSCRPEWIAEGAKTQCTKSNETGTCSALRQCEPNGLSECNAPAAVEEVCDAEDALGAREVGQATGIAIAGGERLVCGHDFRRFFEARALWLAQPDMGVAGGFTGVRAIAALAAAHQVYVQPHNCGGPLATAACVQLSFAIPNFMIQEIVPVWPEDDRLSMVDAPFEKRIQAGHMPLPTGPGLGVEIDPAYLAKCERIT
jgi:hypothetical protein